MRTLGSNTDAAVAGLATEPTFLIAMGFDTPVRFSTRGNVTYDANTYVEASVDLTLTSQPSIEVFNESTQFGQIVLTEGTAGRSVQIWQFYDLTEVELMFDGEMGEAVIGEKVTISCKRRPPNRTPRDVISEPVFRHLPIPGTKISTPNQIITLE